MKEVVSWGVCLLRNQMQKNARAALSQGWSRSWLLLACVDVAAGRVAASEV
jgi:hypothetical protein